MKQKVSTGTAVGIIVGVLLLVGVVLFAVSKRDTKSDTTGEEVVVKINSPNDPKFKADPKLSGGN